MRGAMVYVLVDPRDGEVRYVGWTVRTLAQRLMSHLKAAGDNHRTRWIAVLKRDGLRPIIRLLQPVTANEAPAAERYWIALLRTRACRLVNATDGGEGTLGRVLTNAQRARVSEVHAGKTLSAAHRQAISAAASRKWEAYRSEGRSATDVTRAKIAATKRGQPLTARHRAKLKGARGAQSAEWIAKRVAARCRTLEARRVP